MENPHEAVRMPLLSVVIACSLTAFASDPPLPQPVATLALSSMHPSLQEESTWVSVAFSSETSIAVGLCHWDCASKECSLRLVRWGGGTLRAFAQTQQFNYGASIHPASDGQILAGWWQPTVLYSADLSTRHELPQHLSHVSPSGRTVSESARDSWKLYRLSDKLEPFREGTGELQSVSDEAVVIQERKVLRVESIDGKPLGSFSLPDEAWGYHAALLGNSKLYLDDCRRTVKVVDFEGRTQLEMHPQGGCDQGKRSSADGRRVLFDFASHKASGLVGVLEGLRTITSFGMVGAEDVNREDVRVFDTVTGASCFDWHHSFPSTYIRVSSAAISPSGEFVAIAEGDTLSIYRLPEVCGPQKLLRNK
jgi:hypothetical protein